MKINNLLFSLMLCIMSCLAFSCANLGDSSTDLGNGYAYLVDGSNRWIRGNHVMKNGIYPNVLDCAFNDRFIVIVQEPAIKEYNKFLAQELRFRYSAIIEDLDKSKPDIFEMRFLNSHLWTDSNIHKRVAKEILSDNQASFENLASIADSIIMNDSYYKKIFSRNLNYWIIIKKNNEVLGPFSKKEYFNKRIELIVPKELVLEEN